MQELIKEFLKNNKGYLKKSAYVIAYRLGITSTEENIAKVKESIKQVKSQIKVEQEILNRIKESGNNIFKFAKTEELKIEEPSDIALTQEDLNIEKASIKVLVIGDIHEPFTLEGYLEFCQEQYTKFNCNTVVFIGDIVDNAFSSFHPTNPDGYGAGDELDRAIDKIAKWYEAFPDAIVIVGNHDRLAYRKAFAGGISARWLRDYNDVLGCPNWSFQESITIDNVLYIHGEAGTARTKAKDISQSVVQGHLHSQSYIEWINNRVFSMQVGAGINDSAYAFNYNKAGKESIISCGVILEGKQPILIKM